MILVEAGRRCRCGGAGRGRLDFGAAADAASITTTSQNAAPRTRSVGRGALESFTAAEAEPMDAVARLIPTDETGPGATEAQAVRYIDRALPAAPSPALSGPTPPVWRLLGSLRPVAVTGAAFTRLSPTRSGFRAIGRASRPGGYCSPGWFPPYSLRCPQPAASIIRARSAIPYIRWQRHWSAGTSSLPKGAHRRCRGFRRSEGSLESTQLEEQSQVGLRARLCSPRHPRDHEAGRKPTSPTIGLRAAGGVAKRCRWRLPGRPRGHRPRGGRFHAEVDFAPDELAQQQLPRMAARRAEGQSGDFRRRAPPLRLRPRRAAPSIRCRTPPVDNPRTTAQSWRLNR